MNSDTVKIENLRIRVEEGLVIEITPEKAIKLRDALLEIFPSAPSAPQPIIIEKHIREWPYYRWEPYYWGNTTGATAVYGGPVQTELTSGTLMCNLEA